MDASNGRFSRNFPISVVDKAEVASDSSASTFVGGNSIAKAFCPTCISGSAISGRVPTVCSTWSRSSQFQIHDVHSTRRRAQSIARRDVGIGSEMLQAFLADRFEVKLHKEKMELPVRAVPRH
jgi:hypothetical protein